jgi:hypothetical protein
VRVSRPVKIDGVQDSVWNAAPVSSGFVEYKPGFGDPAGAEYETEVRIMYDNTSLYVLAVMHDPDPSGITREFGLRDQMILSDYFALMINPFRVPGNTYIFGVTASGAQMDGIVGEQMDINWNAVWKSAVKFYDKYWVVEMAIPYSALRFQKAREAVWGINFIRMVTRTRKEYAWNFIDKTKEGDMVQFLGNLKGLRNLKPPVRLSLYPYSSINYSVFQGEKKLSPGFGLDLKYGLNENFTLDMTLIPDFSDVPYDDVILNLGPFEQFYSENRPFFTEGMQLFNRSGIFYSRRIGSRPMDFYKPYYEKNQGEIVVENPQVTKLINAFKLTCRTSSGLGIGLLNAVVNKSEAVLSDTLSGETRRILTSPYTNYNVAVLDYAFGKNNSVGVINTHTFRAGDYPDSNVTAFFYDLNFSHNTLRISGNNRLSVKYDSVYHPGYNMNFEVSKKIRQHGFGFEFYLADDQYDINDLGFMRNNNYVIYDFYYSYSILKPVKRFNSLKASLDVGLDHRFKPYGIFRRDVGFRLFATTRKFFSFGTRIRLISDTKDYYEPRVPGRFYLDPAKARMSVFVSTDYRKRFAFDAHAGKTTYLHVCGDSYSFGFNPRFRFSNQFKLKYGFFYKQIYDEKGFVDFDGTDIIFGKRDVKTVSQKITADYYFTVKSAVSLSLRHYWSPVVYSRFFKLNEDGSLSPVNYSKDKNFNFNVWNLDLGYTWEFAPGSQLTVLYRNSLQNSDRAYQLSYGENLDKLFRQPQRHNFIIKAIYYLDYNTVIKKWF